MKSIYLKPEEIILINHPWQKEMLTKLQVTDGDKAIAKASADNAVRVIMEEVNDIISWGGYEELADGTKVRDGHIMSEPWERLKKLTEK